ncbi:MAG: hypothetical protein H6544_07245 [Prevotellaceae bacterium]|nr:hypothetical protein [Prevotellaceae bacterium]
MKKKIALLLMSLPIALLAQAETVSGSYTSNGVGEKGVKVWSSSGQSTQTNKKGKFSLKKINPETDTLYFEKKGVKSVIVPLSGNSTVTISMKNGSSKVELSIPEKRPSGLYGGLIYTREELEKTGEISVSGALSIKNPQLIPSTFTGNTTPLYFVDGTEVYSIEGIPVKEVGYVEVVKASNAGNAAWGARGANGAIVITTAVKMSSSK